MRLELRFRLQSAVLLSSLRLPAVASLPPTPSAEPFLQELRGFFLGALAAERAERPAVAFASGISATSASSGVSPSLGRSPLASQAHFPDTLPPGAPGAPGVPGAPVPRPAAKKRAPGSLVDPHAR
ncbi:unnamed protein product, partial [Effrenium voratum]